MDLPTYRQQQAHSFYEQIANTTNPVFQQWDDTQGPLPQIGGEPRGVSGFPFQGDNALQLMMAATEHGYTSPLWLTFDQAKACGGSVKRGEIGTRILSWIGKDGEYKPVLMAVFNGDQVSGVALPREGALSPEAQAIRQAGLDALIPPRKRTPKPEQYLARLRDVLGERFPDNDNPQAQAQAALRRELAQLTACARLGLPREVDPAMAQTLAPYADARPHWREVENAINDAHKALQDLGIQPLVFDKVPRREITPEVTPAAEPARRRVRAKALDKEQAKGREQAAHIPF